MKFSAFTLVSRWNKLVRAALGSVLKQEPDEYTVWVDAAALKKHEFFKLIEWVKGKPIAVKMQAQTECEDHHDDVTRAVHTAIMEAEYPWVLNCDDDDEVIGDIRRFMFPLVAHDVGMIWGNKIVVHPKNHPQFVRGMHGLNLYQPGGICGSVILYNKEAMKLVAPNMDVWNPPETYTWGYGYFWDYKIAYWMQRYGYRLMACPDVVCLQNMNIQRSPKRRRLAKRWRDILNQLHHIPRKPFPWEAQQ